VHRSVGTPRSPPFGSREHLLGCRSETESFEALPHPEVADDERIVVAKSSHRDVGERPRPDPGDLRERSERVVGGSLAREIEISSSDEPGHSSDRFGARARHPERIRRELGDPLRRGEQMSDPSGGSLEGGPGASDKAAERRPRPGDGHLLSEDRADDELEAVESAWHADPGQPRDQRCEQRVPGELGVDLRGIGIQVEGPAGASPDQLEVGLGSISRRPDGHVILARRHRDHRGALGLPNRAHVRAVPDLLDAGHGACAEEGQEHVGRERCPDGEPEGALSEQFVHRAGIADGLSAPRATVPCTSLS